MEAPLATVPASKSNADIAVLTLKKVYISS